MERFIPCGGYADLFKLCGDETSAALIPTAKQLAACFAAGEPLDDNATGTRYVRGRIVDMDPAIWEAFAVYVSNDPEHANAELARAVYADLRYGGRIFKPTSDGSLYLAEPCRDDAGQIVDLVWRDDDEWGFSTGLATMLGADQLERSWTESDPLIVSYSPIDYAAAGRVGVCVLWNSCRPQLRKAAFVRLSNWSDVEELAGEVFPKDKGRVQGPQDKALYFTHLHNKVLDELSRLKPPPRWLADPWNWLEERRAARGELPGEPLAVERGEA